MNKVSWPLGAGVLAATMLSVPAAQAGDTAHWSTVATGVTNIARPGLIRTGTDLDVFWSSGGVGTASLWRRQFSQKGAAGPTTSIASGWSTLASDPVPLSTGIATAGLRGNVGQSDYWPGNSFLMTTSGTIAGTLSSAQNAYGSGGQDAALASGMPIYTFTQTLGKVLLHTGTAAGTDLTLVDGGCCTYDPAVKVHSDGTGWVSWYSNSGSPAESGWVVRQVSGLPGSPALGATIQAPGALTGGSSVQPLQRTALAMQADGTSWLAYPVGFPTPKKVRVWQVGTGTYRDIKKVGTANQVSISAGADGRLWVAWQDGQSHKVNIVRSNKSLTQFSSPNASKAPGGASIYSTAVQAGAGTRADVVINTGNELQHRQFLPKLTGSGKVTKVTNNGTIKLKVFVKDAGDPVGKAKVSIQGAGTKKTSAKGIAAFKFKSAKKKAKVVVHKSGYESTTFKVKLKK